MLPPSGQDDESGPHVDVEAADPTEWEAQVGALIEAAESAAEPWQRAQSLVRAALIYETRLHDADKAFVILQAAFQQDVGNEDVARELFRVTGALGRWSALVAECEALLPQLPDQGSRVRLLLALARMHQEHTRDLDAAQRALEQVLALAPGQLEALRMLTDLCVRRGDLAGAVQHLVRAAEGTRDPVEKVRLHLEAGGLCQTQLRAPEQAMAQYRQVLALSPGNAIAAEALGELAWDAGNLAEALPLLELALPHIEGRSPADAARWHARIAESAVHAGDLDKARQHYGAAHALDGGDAATVATFLALAWENQWWPEVRALCEWQLARPESGLSGAVKADCYERLGRACLALGDPAAATGALAKGLEIAPEHVGCRRALVEAHDRAGDPVAAAHHQRALTSLLGTDDERFDELIALGRRYRDQGGDPAAALRAFEDALALRPDDHGTLHEVLDLVTVSKQWKRAVQVLEKLTELEEGQARARYLVATGNILNYELHAADEAVEVYNRALDEDPDDLKTFERIDKILTAKRAWRDEARNYRRMIKRLGPNPPPEKRATLLALWRGLGEICRSRLKDTAAAAAAFEVCANLDPTDASAHEILAEVFELDGPESFAKAIDKRAELLDRATTREDMVRQLRALRRLYLERRQADRVWCVCAALVVCGGADAQEQEFYEQHAARALAVPRGALTEELWQRAVAHPRQDRRISQVLAVAGPVAALVRAREARAWGLDERRRAHVNVDRSLVPSLFAYAGGTLGVAVPALYVHPDVPGDIDLVGVVDGGQLVPALVVGADLVRGRGEREVLFLVARAVARLRWEHLLLWPRVVPSQAELRVVLLAVLKLFMPGLAAPEAAEPAFKQYLALFQRALPPQSMELLMTVLPALADEPGGVDVAGWVAAAEQTANRAGLLVCGDLLVAARLLSEEARAHGGSAEEAVLGLARWSVSPAYLTVREQLGTGLPPEALAGALGPAPPGLVRR